MEKKRKKGGKVKVTTQKRVLTRKQLEQRGVNFLPEDYLEENEKDIFTRIGDKKLRSWEMSVNEFLDRHKGMDIFIYPFSDKKIHWKYNNKEYIRGFAE